MDEAWGGFASANGAPELAPPSCLGKSILASIADGTTAHLYERVFERVRRHEKPVRFPIRCDSPSLRRFLELTIERQPGGFRVHSALLRAEPREPQALLAEDRADDGTLLRMCGWCKRVDAEGAWVEVEEAVRRLNLFERELLPRITHSMCESCYQEVDALLR